MAIIWIILIGSLIFILCLDLSKHSERNNIIIKAKEELERERVNLQIERKNLKTENRRIQKERERNNTIQLSILKERTFEDILQLNYGRFTTSFEFYRDYSNDKYTGYLYDECKLFIVTKDFRIIEKNHI